MIGRTFSSIDDARIMICGSVHNAESGRETRESSRRFEQGISRGGFSSQARIEAAARSERLLAGLLLRGSLVLGHRRPLNGARLYAINLMKQAASTADRPILSGCRVFATLHRNPDLARRGSPVSAETDARRSPLCYHLFWEETTREPHGPEDPNSVAS